MTSLRDLIHGRLPRPAAGAVAGQGSRAPAGVLVLSKHPNPTFSYYLEERLRALAALPVTVKDLDDRLESLDPRDLFVIICRYIKPGQLAWLEENRRMLTGVALFIDDDIAALLVGREAGWLYKAKLFYLAIWPVRRLNRILSDVWASTDALAKTLATGGVVHVLPPLPPRDAMVRPTSQTGRASLKMVYHGTGVHRLEHDFLVPIVAKALEKHPDLHFEVFASGRTARRWRRLSAVAGRLTVRPALPWEDYVAETLLPGIDISLVPLLDGRTNASRSATKRIDVARCGAAAIFSRCPVYQREAMDGELHVGNTAEAWLEAIDALVLDADRRMAARRATALSVDRMRATAPLALPRLPPATATDKRQSL